MKTIEYNNNNYYFNSCTSIIELVLVHYTYTDIVICTRVYFVCTCVNLLNVHVLIIMKRKYIFMCTCVYSDIYHIEVNVNLIIAFYMHVLQILVFV